MWIGEQKSDMGFHSAVCHNKLLHLRVLVCLWEHTVNKYMVSKSTTYNSFAQAPRLLCILHGVCCYATWIIVFFFLHVTEISNYFDFSFWSVSFLSWNRFRAHFQLLLPVCKNTPMEYHSAPKILPNKSSKWPKDKITRVLKDSFRNPLRCHYWTILLYKDSIKIKLNIFLLLPSWILLGIVKNAHLCSEK